MPNTPAPENPLMRTVMLIVYIALGLVGAGGFALFYLADLKPFDEFLLTVGHALLIAGSIAGIIAIVTNVWWLERAALFFLLATLAFLAVPIINNVDPAIAGEQPFIRVGSGVLIVIAAACLALRLYAIRGLWVAPPRRGRVDKS